MSTQKPMAKKISKMELLITALVVTVLASVAIPIYFVSSSRTKLAAADKSLNDIRLSLRHYYAENGSYPLERKFVKLAKVPVNIIAAELKTDYYSIDNFSYTSWDGRSYVVRLTGGPENEWLRRQLTNTGIYSNF